MAKNKLILIFFAISFTSLILILFKKPNQDVRYVNNAKENAVFNLPILNNRDEFGKLLQTIGYKSAIEVGVFKGQFAAHLLKTWPSFEKYYGIDPYVFQKNYKEKTNVPEEQQNDVYNQALQTLTQIGGKRVKLIRKSAIEGVKEFKDYSIDFIYLDGRHDYCAVREELDAYYPKLKCNGIMAGHDFINALVNAETDWRVCENGTKVEIKGGGVKGNLNQLFKNYIIKF